MAEDTELMYEVDIERLHELEAAVKLRHLDRMIELYTEMEKKKTHLVSES